MSHIRHFSYELCVDSIPTSTHFLVLHYLPYDKVLGNDVINKLNLAMNTDRIQIVHERNNFDIWSIRIVENAIKELNCEAKIIWYIYIYNQKIIHVNVNVINKNSSEKIFLENLARVMDGDKIDSSHEIKRADNRKITKLKKKIIDQKTREKKLVMKNKWKRKDLRKL